MTGVTAFVESSSILSKLVELSSLPLANRGRLDVLETSESYSSGAGVGSCLAAAPSSRLDGGRARLRRLCVLLLAAMGVGMGVRLALVLVVVCPSFSSTLVSVTGPYRLRYSAIICEAGERVVGGESMERRDRSGGRGGKVERVLA